MRQILFCVESNPQARTDSMYVDTAIKTSFLIDNNVTINYIYMNGKSRYNDSKTLKRINKYTNMAQKRGTPTSIIYCIDTDNYESSLEDTKLNNEIKAFCEENGYELVWFCRTIEEVFLHKIVNDAEKTKEAIGFLRKNSLGNATIKFLSQKNYSRKKSNLFFVVSKHLNLKDD